MLGITPPDAMLTLLRSLFNSSSLRTANWMWRGMMRTFLLSRDAFPANSRISAAKYSKTAARYTGAPAPMREAYLPARSWLWMRPTGNCSPALDDLDFPLFFAPPDFFPVPLLFPFLSLLVSRCSNTHPVALPSSACLSEVPSACLHSLRN